MQDKPKMPPTPYGFTEIIKIMVIGEGDVGKTTLIHRFVTGKYSDQPMTTDQ